MAQNKISNKIASVIGAVLATLVIGGSRFWTHSIADRQQPTLRGGPSVPLQ
jgi:hypothetical protein